MANAYRRLVAQYLIALAWSLPIAIAPASAYDWLQFGGNPQHSGNNTAELILNAGNVASLMSKFQVTLPVFVDGTPVFLEAVITPGGVKNLLFVTTLDGWILALDAQSGATVWSHQYGPNGCKINHGSSDCYTTSSPAVDPNRLCVYSYGLDGNVHKYQVGDGTEILTGGWPQTATLKGYDEKGSSALSTATTAGATYLYVTHGGYPGDNGDYQGHVTTINLATGAQSIFNAACSDQPVHLRAFGGGISPTCGTHQNAIWSRPGVIYDAGTDRIFMGTGNAFNGTPGQFDGNHNWSESVIALHPDGSGGTGTNTGKPLDSYTPTNQVSLDIADADIGSTAPAILPVPPSSTVQHLAVQGGKDSTLRLLNLQNLSSQGNPGNVGEVVGSIINVPQGGQVTSQPAVWVNPADGSTWIFVVNGSGASGLRLNFDPSGNPSLSTQWHNGQSGTSPIVANNMVFSIGGSTVRALDPVSGSPLWSAARGGSTHWQSVIVANGMVYATDQANHLAAFGLSQNPPPTTATLSGSPSLLGASVTFTATVAVSAPTGTVAFTDGGSVITGCGALALPAGAANSKTAACSISSLSLGTHSIVATYGGDANNAGSASAMSSQIVSGATRADFNADGRSDILWRHASDGTVVMWLMNGMSVVSAGTIGAGTDWSIAGVGDFNGDGKADILWRRASDGAVMMWLMNGMSVVSAGTIGAGTDWSIAGVGDFNGDGKADILWRRASDGAVMMWLMNGLSVVSASTIALTDWSIVGVGDFNGDGKADILWRHASDGTVVMWLMNGMSVVSASTIGAGTDWSIAGVGDFNGDGNADILWRRASDGAVMMWLMNGMSAVSVGTIGAGTDWSIAGVGDFNGDGKADILWRRASDGAVMMWLMNGMSAASVGTIGAGTDWSIAAPK